MTDESQSPPWNLLQPTFAGPETSRKKKKKNSPSAEEDEDTPMFPAPPEEGAEDEDTLMGRLRTRAARKKLKIMQTLEKE